MIAASFLNELAEYVDDKIAKVVINGSYEITDFEVKAVTDNVIGLNYIVPVAEVSLITLVELKTATNAVLTSNPVNVPIAADHMMLQMITVRGVN